jgi:8-amino-7-oxononanoate synthase
MLDDHFLDHKLNERRSQDAFRRLRLPEGKTDFCSNDYLGIATNGLLEEGPGPEGSGAGEGAEGAVRSPATKSLAHGSTGSRLLAGNYPLIEETERALAAFHQAEAGLLFNSGYDANLGVLSCIPQRGDVILYDSLSHASLRDGIRLSFGTAFSFAHNDVADLEKRLAGARGKGRGGEADGKAGGGNIFVVTESVFSMDGDLAPLDEIVALCQCYGAQLILDEAHGTGVIGPAGEGLAQARGWHRQCFARIHTFGKAVGCHGAIVLGSDRLRDYLINFSRLLSIPPLFRLPVSGPSPARMNYSRTCTMSGGGCSN